MRDCGRRWVRQIRQETPPVLLTIATARRGASVPAAPLRARRRSPAAAAALKVPRPALAAALQAVRPVTKVGVAAPEAPQAAAKVEKFTMAPEYIKEPGSGVGIYQVRAAQRQKREQACGCGAAARSQPPVQSLRSLQTVHAKPSLARIYQHVAHAAGPGSSNATHPLPSPQGTDGYMYCDSMRIDDIRAQVDSSPFYLYSQERIRCVASAAAGAAAAVCCRRLLLALAAAAAALAQGTAGSTTPARAELHPPRLLTPALPIRPAAARTTWRTPRRSRAWTRSSATPSRPTTTSRLCRRGG